MVRQLASGDRDGAAGSDVDHVPARGPCRPGSPRCKHTKTGERAHDSIGPQVGQHVAEPSEQRLDLFVGRHRMVWFVLDRGVGRPEQEHPLPRDRERAAGSIEEGEPGMPAVRQRKHRVHAFAQPRQWSSPRIFEQPDAVDPRAGRIHDSSRADRQVLAGDAVDDGDRADGAHSLDRCRAGVVEGHGPGAVRRANRAERQPRIVGRSLLHDSAGEDCGRVEWDELRRVPAPEQPRPRSAKAGDRRVEREGRDELCRLP